MNDPNRKKNEQLGMPIGTAQNRLVKLLILHMARALHKDNCFRCGKRIESVHELSIDHKKPWLDVSVTLYWDMDNVVFSHRSCNSKASRKTWSRVLKAPEGKAWCRGHQKYLPKSKFHKNKTTLAGVQGHCKLCKSKGIGR
jgi:hypothetical protein